VEKLDSDLFCVDGKAEDGGRAIICPIESRGRRWGGGGLMSVPSVDEFPLSLRLQELLPSISYCHVILLPLSSSAEARTIE
jgi:hypothetical protein